MALKKRKKKKTVSRKKTLKRKPIRRAKAKKLVAKKGRKVIKGKIKTKPKEKVIGVVTHYFPHVHAGVIKLKEPLALGEMIKIKGHTTDFSLVVSSMQIDRVVITKASKGQEIGLLVPTRVRHNDKVYRV